MKFILFTLIIFVILLVSTKSYFIANHLAPTEAPYIKEENKSAEKQDKVCVAGCSIGDVNIETLGDIKIRSLLTKLDKEEHNEDSITLDTLLFHHEEVNQHLKNHALDLTDQHWKNIFKEEIARNQIVLHIRVTDSQGKQRINSVEEIKLSGKFHNHYPDIVGDEDLLIGGRSKRVGLHHIWARF